VLVDAGLVHVVVRYGRCCWSSGRVGKRVFLVVFWPAEQALGFGPKLPEAEVAKQWVMMCVCWCARVVLRRLEPV
jgi:hypothetical protein